jgi:hypothetical protein
MTSDASSEREPLWYFAYGSNLSLATFSGRRGIQPIDKRWGWLQGYRLCFDIPIGKGERAVANLRGEAEARTCGVLYLVRAEDAARPDRTEGVDAASIDASGDGDRRRRRAITRSPISRPAGRRRPSALPPTCCSRARASTTCRPTS